MILTFAFSSLMVLILCWLFLPERKTPQVLVRVEPAVGHADEAFHQDERSGEYLFPAHLCASPKGPHEHNVVQSSCGHRFRSCHCEIRCAVVYRPGFHCHACRIKHAPIAARA